MIRSYPNGEAFLRENRSILNTNRDLSDFFFLDAPLLKTADRKNYAIRAEADGECLLALRVGTYPLMLFGSAALAEELAGFLADGGYELGRILGEEALCGVFTGFLYTGHRIRYRKEIVMDFMETALRTAPSSGRTEIPEERDVPELTECLTRFMEDCGLPDPVDPEKVRSSLDRWRVLRSDGRIVSMAKFVPAGDRTMRITNVYTRPEYRGAGCARTVVNDCRNEILDLGCRAVLNVDRENLISNHLYASLGFGKTFSQADYRPE